MGGWGWGWGPIGPWGPPGGGGWGWGAAMGVPGPNGSQPPTPTPRGNNTLSIFNILFFWDSSQVLSFFWGGGNPLKIYIILDFDSFI